MGWCGTPGMVDHVAWSHLAEQGAVKLPERDGPGSPSGRWREPATMPVVVMVVTALGAFEGDGGWADAVAVIAVRPPVESTAVRISLRNMVVPPRVVGGADLSPSGGEMADSCRLAADQGIPHAAFICGGRRWCGGSLMVRVENTWDAATSVLRSVHSGPVECHGRGGVADNSSG